MPVQLGSFDRSKTDPVVIRALTDLANAVNSLEARLKQLPANTPPDRLLAQSVSQVTQRVDDLNRRVLALENP